MCESLVILGCGKRKRQTSRWLPAIERYDGPTFRVLRRFIAERPDRAPNTCVLSGRFGLISGDYPIPRYDRVLRLAGVRRLRDEVGRELSQVLADCCPDRVFVSVGSTYWGVIGDSLCSGACSAEVTIARGYIGGRASRLKRWLGQSGAGNPSDDGVRLLGEATLLGTTVRKTPTEICELGREWLRREPAAARRFQTWRARIDGEHVAPKWLVSLLFNKEVAKFRTADALRVLRELGVAVEYAG